MTASGLHRPPVSTPNKLTPVALQQLCVLPLLVAFGFGEHGPIHSGSALPQAVTALRIVMSTPSWAPWFIGGGDAEVHVTQLGVDPHFGARFSTHAGQGAFHGHGP